jgi:flagellar basal body P-ring formation protein FlgA
MSKLKIFLSFLFIFLLSTTLSHATSIDKKFIENFAQISIENSLTVPDYGQLNVSVSEIDPRIIIHDCEIPLIADIPEQHSSHNINVKISCTGTEPWQLFIAARVNITVPVVVAKMNISKGSMLDDANLTITQLDQSRIRGEVYDQLNEFVGAKSTRNISTGMPLNKRNICLVCKDESVTIFIDHHGLQLKAQGIALNDGILGQEISIKNKRSGKIINARVAALNKVEVFL